MLRGESILCLAPEPWHHIWRNRHQIMSRLAQHNKILFIEPRPYLREVLGDWRRGQIGWQDFRRPRVAQVRENLWSYQTSLYTPRSGRFPLKQGFRWLRESELKRTMRRLGFGQPILWLYRPTMADVIGRFDEKLVIYHIVDKYAAYEAEFESVYGAERRSMVEERERDLVRRADLVLVTSQSLLAEKQRDNPNTHWVPNAVDYASFSQAAQDPNPPADAAALPKPIIGYVGAINEKLDYDLLAQVAARFPDCTLMMVGPVDLRLDLSGLEKLDLPNVHFLGAKPVAQVARYVATCQVCLMPYKLNEWTAHINPLKLFEYMAAGKPIVSTAIPAVEGLDDVVYIAQAGAAFCDLIQRALEQDNARLVRQRMELASRNTWDKRVETISSLIETTLK